MICTKDLMPLGERKVLERYWLVTFWIIFISILGHCSEPCGKESNNDIIPNETHPQPDYLTNLPAR